MLSDIWRWYVITDVVRATQLEFLETPTKDFLLHFSYHFLPKIVANANT